MPIQKTFKGIPVSRVTRLQTGKIQLTFANDKRGDRHPRQVVTESEWKQHGEAKFVAKAVRVA